MPDVRLSTLSPERRLAVGLFLVLILGFYFLAQVKLVTAVGGESAYPGAKDVLVRYHGDRTRSVMHTVLDPALPFDDSKNMYKELGGSDAEKPSRRASILAWVEAGLPREGWLSVAPIFTGEETCARCHSLKLTEGGPRARSDLPFDTYDEVVLAARLDTGMSIRELSTSSHNHLMGFAVIAILTSLIFTLSRWRGPIVKMLILGAFAGAAIDVATWWLTHYYGSPYEYGVLLGGGLFGASVMAMVAFSLDELWLKGAVGALAARILKPLRLGDRAE